MEVGLGHLRVKWVKIPWIFLKLSGVSECFQPVFLMETCKGAGERSGGREQDLGTAPSPRRGLNLETACMQKVNLIGQLHTNSQQLHMQMKVHSFAFVPRRRLCTAFLQSARMAACQLCWWTGTCWASVAAGVRGVMCSGMRTNPFFHGIWGNGCFPSPGGRLHL